jgi:hypothetical protein
LTRARPQCAVCLPLILTKMKGVVLENSQIDPYEWDAYIHASPQGGIQLKYHYLSIVEPSWKAVIVRTNNGLLGVLPFSTKRRFGITYSLQPPLSQYWGICLAPVPGKISSAYDMKKKIIDCLIGELPKNIALFNYYFSPAFDYPLPMIWNGFSLMPRYTYQINLTPGIDFVWNQFAENIRRDIHKAEKNGIVIRETSNIDRCIPAGKRRRVTGSQQKCLSQISLHLSSFRQVWRKLPAYSVHAEQ